MLAEGFASRTTFVYKNHNNPSYVKAQRGRDTVVMQFLADFMVALAHWLQTTPLPGFSLWLQKQPISQVIEKNFLVIPILQTIHIFAVAMLFSSIIMINMRVLMLAGRSRSLGQTLHRYAPWVWWCLLVLVITGVLLAIGEPPRDLTNPAFWTKMVVVPITALITLGVQTSMTRNLAGWEAASAHRGIGARVVSALFILLWCVIMMLGRWIAYVPT